MAQCQANVVICQETQNWQPHGTAEELEWILLKEQKESKAANCGQKTKHEPSEKFPQKHKMGSCRTGEYPRPSLCTCHTTWSGEQNLEGYYKTLKDLDKNMQEVKQQ